MSASLSICRKYDSPLNKACPELGSRAMDSFCRSEVRCQSLLEDQPDLVCRFLADGRITFVNEAFCRHFGKNRDELLDRPLMELFAPEERPLLNRSLTTLHRDHPQASFESRTLMAEGHVRWHQWTHRMLVDGAEQSWEYQTVARDITQRKRIEEVLEITQYCVDCAADAVFRISAQGRYLYVNDAACRALGYSCEELLSMTVHDVDTHFPASAWPNFWRDLKQRNSFTLETDFRTQKGQTYPVELTVSYFQYDDKEFCFAFGHDITARKQLEAQLLRAQRLESLGTLASGIAHDLNNVLAPILMAVQLLRETALSEASRPVLTILENSAQRGANIVKQLLTFGRGLNGERAELQPKHLVREMAKIASETFPKSIAVKVDLPKDLWAVLGDATQLHQVLLNLCINARDAMPQGGTLTLSAETVALDEAYAKMNPEAKAGPYVVLTVTDTGSGIPAAIMNKIFDPFFTTKDPGKGTGLGLSTAIGIAKNHGGFIQVSSHMGKGSQFKVFLPATQSEPQKIAAIAAAPPPAPGRGELILLVEDEDPVRQIAQRILEANGYRVLLAKDGTDAVALYVQHQSEIQLVLTDMVMPIMGGMATIRALQKINPCVAIVAMSGMLAHKQEAEILGTAVRSFLPKPYTAERLLQTLQDALKA